MISRRIEVVGWDVLRSQVGELNSCYNSPAVRLSTKRSFRQLDGMMKGILFKLTFSLFVKSLKD